METKILESVSPCKVMVSALKVEEQEKYSKLKKDDCLRGSVKDCFEVINGHSCNSKCLMSNPSYDALMNMIKEKKIPFLAVTMLLGWQRITTANERTSTKIVTYQSPCQKQLFNFDELHDYLLITGCQIPINFFSFRVGVNIRNVFFPISLPVISDVTNGEEFLPISVVNIFGSNTDTLASRYITEFTYDQSVKRNDDPNFLVCCSCTDDCKDKLKCPCFQLTLQNCDPQTRAKFNNCEIGYSNKLLRNRLLSGIFECNRMCKCRQSCMNRVVQHGTIFQLQIFKTFDKGWGVRTLHDIPEGCFVCKYVGNMITVQRASKVKVHDEDWKYMANLQVAQPFKDGYEHEAKEPNGKRFRKSISAVTSSKRTRQKKPATYKKKITFSSRNKYVGWKERRGAGNKAKTSNYNFRVNCQRRHVVSSLSCRSREKRDTEVGSPDSGIFSSRESVQRKRKKQSASKRSKLSVCEFFGAPVKLGRNLVVKYKRTSTSLSVITANECSSSSLMSHTVPITDGYFQKESASSLTRTDARKSNCKLTTIQNKNISLDKHYHNLYEINNKSYTSLLKRSRRNWIYSASVESKGISGISFSGSPLKNHPRPKPEQNSLTKNNCVKNIVKNVSSLFESSTGKYNLRPQKIDVKSPHKITKRNSLMKVGKFCADAKIEGNIGRYINHSCEPNIFPQLVFTESQDLNFPILGLFACDDIKAGTELSWDYNYEVDERTSMKIPCRCGSKKCKGRLL